MLRARLLDGTPSRTWVDKIPGIMLTLNVMAYEPHGFSASMIATGREPTLPPDLESNACASPSLDDPAAYVDAIKQRLSVTHQQRVPPPPPPQSATPAGGSPSPPASSKSTSPAATPPPGQRLTRGAAAANRNSASRSSKPPPPASAQGNDNARSSLQPRRSARLNPQACTIKSVLPAPAPQSLSNTMARTYPLSLAYNQCLGSKEDP